MLATDHFVADIPSPSSRYMHAAFARQVVLAVSALFCTLFGLIMLAHFSELPALNRMRVLNPVAGAVPFVGSLLLLIAVLKSAISSRIALIALTLTLTIFGNIGVYQNGAMTYALGSAFLLLLSMMSAPPKRAYLVGIGAATFPVLVQLISPLPMDEGVSHRVFATLLSIILPMHTLLNSEEDSKSVRWLVFKQLLISGIVCWATWHVLFRDNSETTLGSIIVSVVILFAVSRIKSPPTALKLALGILPIILFFFALDRNGSSAIFALPMWMLATFLLLDLSIAAFVSGILLLTATFSVDVLGSATARGLISAYIFYVMLSIWFYFRENSALSSSALSLASLKANRRHIVVGVAAALLVLGIVNTPFFLSGFTVEADGPGIRWAALQLFIFILLTSGIWSYLAHQKVIDFEKDKLRLELEKRVDELREANASAESARKALAERQEKQSQVFSIIGHELRTPLASIRMMFDEIELQTFEPYGPQILHTHDAVMGILDDLKIVTQPDRVRENNKSVDAPSMIAERTVSSLSKYLHEQNFNVHISYDNGSNQPVEVNSGALRQVITNLVKNAALHSQGTDAWVSLTSSRGAGLLNLILRVEDNGKGIPKEQRGRIFDAFGRGETTADGTGLGLYIIKELSGMLAGDIEYFDSDRGGAGFKLHCSLPVVSKHLIQEGEATPTSNLLKGKNVLFAEDQLTLQALTKSLLIKQGASPAVANNGVEALELFGTQEFDVVLTDAMMPDMDGYALSKALRQRGFKGPIVAITAAVIGEETENLLASGVDIVMTKPINIRELNSNLARLGILATD